MGDLDNNRVRAKELFSVLLDDLDKEIVDRLSDWFVEELAKKWQPGDSIQTTHRLIKESIIRGKPEQAEHLTRIADEDLAELLNLARPAIKAEAKRSEERQRGADANQQRAMERTEKAVRQFYQLRDQGYQYLAALVKASADNDIPEGTLRRTLTDLKKRKL